MSSILKKFLKLPSRGPRSLLSIEQILTWADAHHAATGSWPTARSGRIRQSPFDESWAVIDEALRSRRQGLPEGFSLMTLLHEHRGAELVVSAATLQKRNRTRRRNKAARGDRRKSLTITQILAWADAHHATTGAWPNCSSGSVADAPGERWGTIDEALRVGRRFLPGGSSIARLLDEQRPERCRTLTVETILAWADAHHAATGNWPVRTSGAVCDVPGETWCAVEQALHKGLRGLPGGSSLSRLLDEHRPQKCRELTVETILTWADAYHAATGKWPTTASGPIGDGPFPLTWSAIDGALRNGHHGLPGGLSIARLLHEQRGTILRVSAELRRSRAEMARRHKADRPDGWTTLDVPLIVAWADAHHAATGKWPDSRSGGVRDAPGEVWITIDNALRYGRRGLVGGSSLTLLLDEHRPQRCRTLTMDSILAWADAHHAATGRWPSAQSGAVLDAPGESWRRIDVALSLGLRGLPAGSSLARLLRDQRRGQSRTRSRELTLEQIQAWGEAHRAATGDWPNPDSGPIAGAPGEKWANIDAALRSGHRGLPAGHSLSRVLGLAPTSPRPRLTLEQIQAWGEAHRAATGDWPNRDSGPIPGAPGETWAKIRGNLFHGHRGLPAGMTLARLFASRATPAAPEPAAGDKAGA